MNSIKFVPSVCKEIDGKPPTFEGFVMIKPPSFDQRMDYVTRCNFKIDEKGDAAATTVIDQVPAIRAMVSCSQPHYESVNLKNIETGEEYKSFEDLTYDPACDAVLGEVARLVLQGVKPGKNSKS